MRNRKVTNPYLDKATGWTTVAGSEVSTGPRRICRYLLAANEKQKKYAILTTDGKVPVQWNLKSEGDGKQILKEWEVIDGPDLSDRSR